MFDLKKAAESKTYCDEVAGVARKHGLAITELSTHLQGQLVAVHPAYNEAFDAFAPAAVHGKPKERQAWAVQQLRYAATASRHLGLHAHVTFSGALAWPFAYPWPQRPTGLVEEAFFELAKRWKPILDAYDEVGVDVCYEIHPGEDLFDGATFELFVDRLKGHKRANINYDPSHFVLQHLDYLAFIDIYHERIKAFHVKDAELNPRDDKVSIRVMHLGSRGQDASDRSATARSISPASFPNSPSTITIPGRCLNGNAVSNIPRTAPARARPSSRAISSASPRRPSMTSPAARRTKSNCGACWGSQGKV